jgi:hypothetical protein
MWPAASHAHECSSPKALAAGLANRLVRGDLLSKDRPRTLTVLANAPNTLMLST